MVVAIMDVAAEAMSGGSAKCTSMHDLLAAMSLEVIAVSVTSAGLLPHFLNPGASAAAGAPPGMEPASLERPLRVRLEKLVAIAIERHAQPYPLPPLARLPDAVRRLYSTMDRYGGTLLIEMLQANAMDEAGVRAVNRHLLVLPELAPGAGEGQVPERGASLRSLSSSRSAVLGGAPRARELPRVEVLPAELTRHSTCYPVLPPSQRFELINVNVAQRHAYVPTVSIVGSGRGVGVGVSVGVGVGVGSGVGSSVSEGDDGERIGLVDDGNDVDRDGTFPPETEPDREPDRDRDRDGTLPLEPEPDGPWRPAPSKANGSGNTESIKLEGADDAIGGGGGGGGGGGDHHHNRGASGQGRDAAWTRALHEAIMSLPPAAPEILQQLPYHPPLSKVDPSDDSSADDFLGERDAVWVEWMRAVGTVGASTEFKPRGWVLPARSALDAANRTADPALDKTVDAEPGTAKPTPRAKREDGEGSETGSPRGDMGTLMATDDLPGMQVLTTAPASPCPTGAGSPLGDDAGGEMLAHDGGLVGTRVSKGEGDRHLVLQEPVGEGSVIVEYHGELVVDCDSMVRALSKYHTVWPPLLYILRLGTSSLAMDISRVASHGRLAEHCSCNPTCELHACRTRASDGSWVPRLVLLAGRPLASGQLATVDYTRFSISGRESHVHADWILQLRATTPAVRRYPPPTEASITTLVNTHAELSSSLARRHHAIASACSSAQAAGCSTPSAAADEAEGSLEDAPSTAPSASSTTPSTAPKLPIQEMPPAEQHRVLVGILKRLRKEPCDLLHCRFRKSEQASERRLTKELAKEAVGLEVSKAAVGAVLGGVGGRAASGGRGRGRSARGRGGGPSAAQPAASLVGGSFDEVDVMTHEAERPACNEGGDRELHATREVTHEAERPTGLISTLGFMERPTGRGRGSRGGGRGPIGGRGTGGAKRERDAAMGAGKDGYDWRQGWKRVVTLPVGNSPPPVPTGVQPGWPAAEQSGFAPMQTGDMTSDARAPQQFLPIAPWNRQAGYSASEDTGTDPSAMYVADDSMDSEQQAGDLAVD